MNIKYQNCRRWVVYTALVNDIVHLLEFLTEAFQCHVHHFQCLAEVNLVIYYTA